MTQTNATEACPKENVDRRSEVARAVWPWDTVSKPSPERSAKRPFWRVALQSVWIVIVGLTLFWGCGRRTAGSVLFVFATVLFSLALVAPAAYRALDRGVLRLAEGLGRALNVLILAPFFYLVFTPGRLFLKLSGRDPMGRRFPLPDRGSFWTRYKGRTSMDSYKEQH
ncbi:MAG: hypothetical protein U1E27_12265 [Kiritimatiellia bacterium]|nr:hypothetical protein [Kiritimatiellia bacterium]